MVGGLGIKKANDQNMAYFPYSAGKCRLTRKVCGPTYHGPNTSEPTLFLTGNMVKVVPKLGRAFFKLRTNILKKVLNGLLEMVTISFWEDW